MPTHLNVKPHSFLNGLLSKAGIKDGLVQDHQKLSEFAFLGKIDELDIIFICHPKFDAAISLQGAQLLNWQLRDGPETFWLSPLTPFKRNQPIRGGVPICWPWFGKSAFPAHGFARTSLWQLDSLSDDSEKVNLSITLNSTDESRSIWPYEFSLCLQLYLSDTCEFILESRGNFKFTCALHSYFHISHVNNAHVLGLGSEFINSLNNQVLEKETSSSVTFKDHIDRIYTQSNKKLELIDEMLSRKILIENSHGMLLEKQNSCDSVIWNPGIKLSHSMQDMPDDGYLSMGCIESAVVSQAVQLTSSSVHQLKLNVTPFPL
ncbi:D-hexose-6-phosphate mutarotase [Thorsellia kenyensis]|uniref:Putative glucose-6-phosphate 1-epimerase n=1 Tax=Thorsellia kenyensis TaxID=1549888 RepID=A0ABV6CA42_9GAMM